MNKSKCISCCMFFICLVLFLFTSDFAVAGTTGKIAGKVVDASTGDPLPGAEIQIVGTTLGASSDANGDYFILNVFPGAYSVQISFIGYKVITTTGVRVRVDKTSSIDYKLEATTIEGEEVQVVAVRPPVEKDLTSSKSIVDGETIEKLSITDLSDIIANLPGVVKHNNEIHIRGGRLGEELHLVDGVSIRDPLFNGAIASINPNAIEQFEVITGTFNAEYGQALSGVFNTVLKEGGDKWSASVTYRSSIMSDGNFGELSHFTGEGQFDGQDIYDETLNTEDNVIKAGFPGFNDGDLGYFDKNHSLVEGTLGGPLTQKISFFLSGRFEDNPTSFPAFGTKQFNIQPKLTFRVSDVAKLSIQGMVFDREGPFDPSFDINKVNGSNGRHNYWLWKYNLDAFPVTNEDGFQVGLTWSHTLNKSTFYDIRTSFFTKDRIDATLNANGDPLTLNGSEFNSPNHIQNISTVGGASQVGYFDGTNTYGIFNDNAQKSYTFEGNITSQVSATHQLKGGVQLTSFAIDRVGRDTWFGRAVDPDAVQLQEVHVTPIEGAIYAQDRMEFSDMILNLGARLDVFNVNADNGVYDEQVTETGEISRFPNPFTGDRKNTENFVRVSPRLGFSHPVGENRAIHYAYGTFFQRPRFYDLLENYLAQNDGQTESGFFIYLGNPNLKPQITTSYEIGIQQGLGDVWHVDVTGFYKDISNLVSNKEVFNNTATDPNTNQQFSHFFYKSSDHFGNIKGGEVSIERSYSGLWSGRLSYTFNVAKGTASGPVSEGAGIFREGSDAIVDDKFFLTTLDFTRDHVVNGYVDIRTRWNESGTIGQAGANLLFNLQSGLPVTSRVGLAQATLGEESPMNWRVDAKFDVTLNLGSFNPNIFLFVENLFNRRNVLSVKDPGSFFREGDNFFENAAGPRNDLTAYDLPITAHLGISISY